MPTPALLVRLFSGWRLSCSPGARNGAAVGCTHVLCRLLATGYGGDPRSSTPAKTDVAGVDRETCMRPCLFREPGDLLLFEPATLPLVRVLRSGGRVSGRRGCGHLPIHRGGAASRWLRRDAGARRSRAGVVCVAGADEKVPRQSVAVPDCLGYETASDLLVNSRRQQPLSSISSTSGFAKSIGRLAPLERRPVSQYTSHTFPSGSRT